MRTFLLIVLVAAIIAVLALPVYFQSRRNSEPDAIERTLAFLWQVARRIVSFGAALLFIFAAFAGSVGEFSAKSLVMSLVCLLFAFYFIKFGMYGAGKSRGLLDAKQVYEARKRRYRWRW